MTELQALCQELKGTKIYLEKHFPDLAKQCNPYFQLLESILSQPRGE